VGNDRYLRDNINMYLKWIGVEDLKEIAKMA
jgi:hypothetical protein